MTAYNKCFAANNILLMHNIETTLLCENGRSVPRASREQFDIFS